jgi:hypothetical protein
MNDFFNFALYTTKKRSPSRSRIILLSLIRIRKRLKMMQFRNTAIIERTVLEINTGSDPS